MFRSVSSISVVLIMGCFKDCPLHPSRLMIILRQAPFFHDGYSWCTFILSFLHVFLISLTLSLSHSWATWCTACSSLQQVVLVLLSYNQSGYFFSVLKTDYAKADFTVAHFSVTIDNSFSLSYTHYWNTFLVVTSPLICHPHFYTLQLRHIKSPWSGSINWPAEYLCSNL